MHTADVDTRRADRLEVNEAESGGRLLTKNPKVKCTYVRQILLLKNLVVLTGFERSTGRPPARTLLRVRVTCFPQLDELD